MGQRSSTCTSSLFRRLALALLALSMTAAVAQNSGGDSNKHVGVATCAGSTCHGSTRPISNSPVRQDEYFIWQQKDAHQNAFKLLLKPAAKRIADNLGIKDASKATECLTCHSDFVPEAQRGPHFSLSEGVGCEACHGGAKNWLGPHVSGNTHAQNVAQGLIPLENPSVRAKLCLDCHQGTAAKPITHRIMGAGHPPLEFELAFNSLIQPAHFKVDGDYRKRKNFSPSGAMWATGQLVSGQVLLDGLASERLAATGLTPELVFFECASCHHAMRPPRWNPGLGGSQEPGQLRLADSSLVLSALILRTLDLPSAKSWDAALKQLHDSSRQSLPAIKTSAADLRKLADSGLSELRNKTFAKADVLNLMAALATAGGDKLAGDFTVAKQIYYGLDALNSHLQSEMQLPEAVFSKSLGEVFDAVDDSRRPYDPDRLRKALESIKATVAAQNASS